MFKIKKHALLFKISLFILLGLLFVINNYCVMAMETKKTKIICLC
ncbi:putative secreted protein, SVM family protein [Candidatus Phytoplasma solani]